MSNIKDNILYKMICTSSKGSGGGELEDGSAEFTENGEYKMDVSKVGNLTVNVDVKDDVASVIAGNVIELSNSDATSVVRYALYRRTLLEKINLPACKTIEYGAFDGCVQLEEIDFPACETVEAGAFANCSKLKKAHLHECTTIIKGIGYPAFANCPLTLLHFGNFDRFLCNNINVAGATSVENLLIKIDSCNEIYENNTYSGYTYSNLMLCNKSVVTINSPATSHMKVTTLYVPDSLVDAYKSHANWSSIATNIKPISEYVEPVV